MKYDIESIKTLMTILGMATESSEIISIIKKYYSTESKQADELLSLPTVNIKLLDYKQQQYRSALIVKHKAYGWTNTINEFKGLALLVYSFLPTEQQEQYQPQLNQAITTLNSLHNNIKTIVWDAHPGFSKINTKRLQQAFTGSGTRIAVFDLFEESLLATQRKEYSTSIKRSQVFGDPVEMNHGNAVIDIILSIAPNAIIIPISADTKNYNKALEFIINQKDITVVNMSRTFLEKEKELDQTFQKLLVKLAQQTIVTKSLGNCGTDLFGNLSPIRQRLGLGEVGAITCYDTKLINQFLTDPLSRQHQQNILYAINVNPFADQTSLTATIPGNLPKAQLHSIAIPAEGVYTAITNNFESGSSFAAPQLAAVITLLYQASNNNYPYQDKSFHLWYVIQAIKETTNNRIKNSNEFGLGLLNGDEALKFITGNPKI
ncbi:S8 family serine peptidase [Endozoicomonas sp. SM1973]|uniref:S8 family serine peptidase n=1 Tax=Spartinivicinus marinus TaxID=2994442 RepID=A0A853HYU2_9GAMM|nr:S8 family serine peptidase [Spartinivicinus marinus]MCX4027465.1 S8 family serine peptidase [Spartinivicinus marinus]NYZ66363.1 S8 family serine peptidase [Spartinivicinus marinus]